MRRRFLTSVLLSLVLAVSVLFGSLVTVVADGGIQNITSSDFNKTDWEQNLSGGNLGMSFVSESEDYETTVSTNQSYSGSYSVVFKRNTVNAPSDAESIQCVVALGADTQTKIPLNAVSAYWNTPNDNTIYIAITGIKIYIFDRNSGDGNDKYQDNGNGNTLGTSYWKLLHNFYASKGATLHGANMKFEVVSGETTDQLKIYTSKSAEALPTTPVATIDLHEKGVADGYVQFSQRKMGTSSFGFNNVKINDTVLQKSDLSVLGRTDLVTIEKTYPTDKAKFYDVNITNEYVLSNFFVYDNGIEEGQEVFSLSFKSQRYSNEGENHYWGLVLGVDESGDLSTGKEIKFGKMGTFGADEKGGICVYQCTSSEGALPERLMNYTIKGYAGGKVEVIHDDKSGYAPCPTHTDVFYNVDFNGKIAFKIFDNSGLDNGYWQVSNVSFNGQGSYTAIQSLAVTTIVDGVSTVNPVQQGGAFTPTAPTKAGEIFIGWNYTDSDETNVYKSADFSIASVQESVTLEAIFVDLHIKGASVKTNGTQGLRFAAEISADDKAVLGGLGVEVKYGILLTNEENKNLDIPCQNWFNEEKTMYTAVLKDLQEQHANDKFTAKAYVEIGGVKYFSDAQTRSIAEVSKEAVNDYKAQSEGLYVYEVEGKWYKVDYTANDLDYLNAWANKIEG